MAEAGDRIDRIETDSTSSRSGRQHRRVTDGAPGDAEGGAPAAWKLETRACHQRPDHQYRDELSEVLSS